MPMIANCLNYFNHQCVGVPVMVDMTNLNLEITKDLTSVHFSSSIVITKISVIGYKQRVSDCFTVKFIPIHAVHLIIQLYST